MEVFSFWCQVFEFCSAFSHLYWVQTLTFFGLVLITLFRREMSCNHEYIKDENEVEIWSLWRIIQWNRLRNVFIDENDFLSKCNDDGDASSHKTNTDNVANEPLRTQESTRELKPSSSAIGKSDNHNIFTNIPSDTQFYLFSFLNPKDLTIFSCVSRDSNSLASNPFIWKNLLLRDYHHILVDWPLAQSAFERFHPGKNCTIIDFLNKVHSMEPNNKNNNSFNESPNLNMKDLYFHFSKSWIDWALAGLNTFESCYIGLHNSVFNITNFIHDHPGSPETILIHAGRDATNIFEDLGHSKGARKIAASKLCEINLGYEYYRKKSDEVCLPMMRSKRKRKKPGILFVLQKKWEEEAKQEEIKIRKWRKENMRVEILGHVNKYYDPFYQKWRWWYSDMNMIPSFIKSVD